MTRITGSEPGFYQDLGELQKIKSNPDQRAALEAAAGQFEVTFLQTVLKHMRAASDALQDEDEKLIKGNELYRDMYDSQLAMGLVKGGGIGLTRQMVAQLEPPLKNPATAVASGSENLAAFTQPLHFKQTRKAD
ncbi:rod-binding protein [Aeromonas diversa]|uniref:Peptidoglycan hydrolase n=1 Tax=Aeromonas diversa CDC 2478-85 TaxID=1268237 RepID=N9VJ26_9GAMM|nr:rod-binding protein [Aeromonas diversa]ENY71406.1 peptidoglycan hydrolase [Aeromonas diversa CDC 2478-85]